MNSLAVKKGREWMETHDPDWRNKINWDILDIRIWSKCILGQVFGLTRLPMDYPKEMNEYGFFSDHTDEANKIMVELWKKEANELHNL